MIAARLPLRRQLRQSTLQAGYHRITRIERSTGQYVRHNSDLPRPLNLIFMGAPGVGKGTYGSRLAPILGIPIISTGDIIRSEIKTNSTLGQTMQSYSKSGRLVPDEIVAAIVDKRLSQSDCQDGYLLDGYPRTVHQAELLNKISRVNLVVNICLPEWVLTEKVLGRRLCSDCGTGYNVANIYHNDGELNMPPLLPKVEGVCDQCGGQHFSRREDDTEEVVRHRLEVYNKETMPMIDYYEEHGIIKHFHVKKGLQDLEKLLCFIKESLRECTDSPDTFFSRNAI